MLSYPQKDFLFFSAKKLFENSFRREISAFRANPMNHEEGVYGEYTMTNGESGVAEMLKLQQKRSFQTASR